MPALYNAHAHAPMTLLRGYAENLPLQRWLEEKCFPFEAKMTAEDCYWGTVLACAEMARFGVVSFSDMYYATEERARAVLEAGMKANMCEGLVAFEEKPYAEYPICAQMEALVRDWHGAGDGRIRIDYNIHSEYLSTETVCRDILDIVRGTDLRLHIHLSETEKEVRECRERHGGLTPVAYFDSLGLFEVPVTAAHCVWVDDADLDILQRHGVFVANNPASNMKLGSGFAPIPEVLRRGIPVCLGSDGMASNNNHNLFHDMYLQALIYKGATLDPTAVTPQQALAAATRTGALSQGREDCGVVAEGARADLCVLDITGPSWCPAPDPVYNLVYAGDGADVVAHNVRWRGDLSCHLRCCLRRCPWCCLRRRPRCHLRWHRAWLYSACCHERRMAHHRYRARQGRVRHPHRPHHQRAIAISPVSSSPAVPSLARPRFLPWPRVSRPHLRRLKSTLLSRSALPSPLA
ncbi:MAG: amidohydrolase [Adlercreutzia equolifaciens]